MSTPQPLDTPLTPTGYIVALHITKPYPKRYACAAAKNIGEGKSLTAAITDQAKVFPTEVEANNVGSSYIGRTLINIGIEGIDPKPFDPDDCLIYDYTLIAYGLPYPTSDTIPKHYMVYECITCKNNGYDIAYYEADDLKWNAYTKAWQCHGCFNYQNEPALPDRLQTTTLTQHLASMGGVEDTDEGTQLGFNPTD